jgi:hypothetical protein
MEFYDFRNNLVFDEYVEYKGIKIYPITIKYYQIVKASSDAFSQDIVNEKDIELIGLPYMEYMQKKALKYPDFLETYDIFNTVIQLSLKEQLHSFRREGEFLKLVIAIPTKDYSEEKMCVYRKKLNDYRELTRDEFHRILNKLQAQKLYEEIEDLANELFTLNVFDDKDFENIKNIICNLNDIDTTIIKDLRWKKELEEAQEIMNELNSGKNNPQFEDLVNVVAMSLNKLPSEIKDMTIRRFDRYLTMILDKENYLLCKQAELSGAEFKTPITHWLKGYKMKTRYSGVQTIGSGIQEVLKE